MVAFFAKSRIVNADQAAIIRDALQRDSAQAAAVKRVLLDRTLLSAAGAQTTDCRVVVQTAHKALSFVSVRSPSVLRAMPIRCRVWDAVAARTAEGIASVRIALVCRMLASPCMVDQTNKAE